LQHPQVLADRGAGDGEGLGEVTHAQRSPGEALDHRAPGGVRQGVEDPRERIRRRLHVTNSLSKELVTQSSSPSRVSRGRGDSPRGPSCEIEGPHSETPVYSGLAGPPAP